jgi:hypothetical protein
MKKLLLVTAAVAAVVASVASVTAGQFMNSEKDSDEGLNYECLVVKVTPADHDRDPGYKVNVFLDGNGFNSTVHTTVSGKTYERSDQYTNLKTWNAWKNGQGPWMWSGWLPNFGVKMVGTIGTDKGGKVFYDELVYRGDKVATTIHTVCHSTFAS